MAWFSSDRTIREYAEDIWNVPVGPVVSVSPHAQRA
jgi:starch phosphorylase